MSSDLLVYLAMWLELNHFTWAAYVVLGAVLALWIGAIDAEL